MFDTMHFFWDAIVLYSGVALAWLAGEFGKIYVSGAAGGLVRTLVEGRKELRNGVIAVIVGAICAHYLSPIAFWGFQYFFDGVVDSPETQRTAAFTVGLGGMSFVKILIAFMEIKASKVAGVFANSGVRNDNSE